MLSRKPRLGRLNDGALVLYGPTAERDAQGVDFSTPEGCAEIAVLHFESMMNRAQDIEMADAEGATLTRKLRVRAMPGLSTGQLAEIDGVMHAIWKVDVGGFDSAYLYTESLETDGTVQLSRRVGGRDSMGRPNQGWTEPVTAHVRKASWSDSRDTATPHVGPQPTLRVTLRRCDWDGWERIERDGKPHTVESVESRGEWVDVVATRREGNDGE